MLYSFISLCLRLSLHNKLNIIWVVSVTWVFYFFIVFFWNSDQRDLKYKTHDTFEGIIFCVKIQISWKELQKQQDLILGTDKIERVSSVITLSTSSQTLRSLPHDGWWANSAYPGWVDVGMQDEGHMRTRQYARVNAWAHLQHLLDWRSCCKLKRRKVS